MVPEAGALSEKVNVTSAVVFPIVVVRTTHPRNPEPVPSGPTLYPLLVVEPLG